MIIRKIRAAEIDNIVILTEYFRDELKIEDWNTNSILDTIREFSIQITDTWLVAFDNQRPVGFIMGNVNKYPWNEDLYGVVEMFYLLPSHRNPQNQQELLEEFTNWARNLGADRIKVIDIDTKNYGFYEQQGFNTSTSILDKVMA